VKRVHDHVIAVQKKLNNEAVSTLKRDAKKSYEFLSKLRRLSGALESDATAETEFDLGEREKKLVELATLLSPANGASIFESKGGIRASSVCPKGQGDILGDFEKSALGKTSIRGIKKHLQGSPWGVLSLAATDQKAKKLDKVLKKAFDGALFSRLPLPVTTEWAGLIYGMQVMGARKGFQQIGLLHFACMEARVCISGEAHLIGIVPSVVPGANLREKRAFLSGCGVDEVHSHAVQGGWGMKMDPGSAVVLPTGFMVVSVFSEDTYWLRWSISSDEQDTNRVKAGIKAITDAYPEMRNASSGHTQFYEFLDA
jgi:hypothetical protein